MEKSRGIQKRTYTKQRNKKILFEKNKQELKCQSRLLIFIFLLKMLAK